MSSPMSQWINRAGGWLAVFAMLLGTIGIALVLMQRVPAERLNNSVELVADWNEFELLALRENIDMDQVLAELAGSGVTAVAVSETTPDRLTRLGEATLLTGVGMRDRLRQSDQLAGLLVDLAGEIDMRNSYLLFSDPDIFEQARLGACKLVDGDCRYWSDGQLWVLEVPIHHEQFRGMGLGIWQRDLEAVSRHGLTVIPRFSDRPGITPGEIAQAFDEVAGLVVISGVIFSGDAVLGASAGEEGIRETAAQLSKRGIPLGIIEAPELLGHFHQRGMDSLLRQLDYQAARVYSIPPDYLASLRPAAAVDIWVRSPLERNIRILYLRPIYSGGDSLATTTAAFSQLRERLLDNGWQLGQAGTFPFYSLGIVEFLLLLTGTAGVALWLLARFVHLHPVLQAVLLAGQVLGFLGLAKVMGMYPAREAAALLVALVAPILSSDVVLRRWWRRRHEEMGLGRTLLTGAGDITAAFGVMIWCSFLLASLLGDTQYWLELRYFRGVKLSFIVPPVLVVLAYWWRFGLGDATAGAGQGMAARWADFIRLLQAEVRWYHLLLGAVLAVAGALYILRSGNLTQEFVPGYELLLRQLLEDWLVARPRFKEFVLGYPALLLGGWLLSKRQYWLLWLAALGGSVGMVSVINSFEHVRTPLLVSLLRGFNGFWLGLLIGAVAVVVAELAWRFLQNTRRAIIPGRGPGAR